MSFERMDLAELDRVRDATAEVLETGPRTDALICNAAIAQVPTQKLTVDGHESILGTNHHGHPRAHTAMRSDDLTVTSGENRALGSVDLAIATGDDNSRALSPPSPSPTEAP